MFETIHDTEPASRFVHLGIRSDLRIRGAFDEVLDRLDTLAAEERLAGYDVTMWPAHVKFDVEPADDSVLDRFLRFWSWAEAEDLRISPAFRIRQGSTMLDEYEQVLDTPVMFAWVTVDEEIKALAPCSDGSVTYSLDALLDELQVDSVGSNERLLPA